MGRAIDSDLLNYFEFGEAEGLEEISRSELRRLVRKQEQALARRVLLNRCAVAACVLAAASAAAGALFTVRSSDQPSQFAVVDAVCGVVFAVSVSVWMMVWRVPLPSHHELSLLVENNREEQRWFNADTRPSVEQRRSLYREDVADLIEQYQSDSRHYRRIYNSLQVLIMTGSAGSTTVAALDWGQQPTWQSVTLTCISFAITLAAAFTGYYKYRERSYFLQETADSIETHANALTLGIGDYADLDDHEDEALARFTANVERLRNEQRVRQQQLDQPSEQAVSTGQSPA